MINESRGVVFGEDKSVSYGTLPLRPLEANDILIKVHSAAINPSDVAYIQGHYPSAKSRPVIAGSEGSGLIIETGSAPEAAALKGKRVAFFALGKTDQGSWGEYVVINRYSAFPIPDSVTYEEAACALVNPLTVEAFILICKESNHTAIVHSGASSSLGKMLIKACKNNNITLINIVRRKEHVDTLHKLGAEHVLDSSDAAFEADLSLKISQHHPSGFFDSVGGKVGSTIFTHLPPGSTAYVYGLLSGDPQYNVPASDLIFKKKVLRGFWLSTEMADPARVVKIVGESFKGLAEGDYKSHIVKSFNHEQVKKALEFYQKNASEGKVILSSPVFNN